MKTGGEKRRVHALYCTYCSADKNRARAPMPAVRRYLSKRIRTAHRMSRREGVSFAILSGEFGLLGPYEKIPYYDHLLRADAPKELIPPRRKSRQTSRPSKTDLWEGNSIQWIPMSLMA